MSKAEVERQVCRPRLMEFDEIRNDIWWKKSYWTVDLPKKQKDALIEIYVMRDDDGIGWRKDQR